MTLLNCIWYSQISFSVIFIHFVRISQYLEKNAPIHTFFNHQSLIRLIFGQLYKHASILFIQSNDTWKTGSSQGWWFVICQFAFAHHISNVWLVRNQKFNALQYVPPGWFEECDHGVSACQFLHDSDTVRLSKLKNVLCTLNPCLLRRHLYTIQCHMTTFCYRPWLSGNLNWPRLPSWIGFFTARWQW